LTRTPEGIGAKRRVAGSKHGLQDWLLQRVTAVVLAAFTLVVLVSVLTAGNAFEAWQSLFAGGWTRVLAYLTWLSLSYHAWVGVRDIWMDYVKPLSFRLSLNVFTALWLLASAVYCASVLWS
jgi:succinate dehydrogenase / fumarate reductase membrane anchor subunit